MTNEIDLNPASNLDRNRFSSIILPSRFLAAIRWSPLNFHSEPIFYLHANV